MNVSAVSDRVIGAYPLSIATSLAIEGGLGNHPDRKVEGQPLLKYDAIWVNLKTLFRNLFNAIEKDRLGSVKAEDLYGALVQEIFQFRNIVQQESGGKIEVIYYMSDYRGMEYKYPKAILRTDTTPNQLGYTKAMIDTLGLYVKNHQGEYKSYALKMTDKDNRKLLILTHYPYDLFAEAMPGRALLESHTGAVKERHLWYTKYLNGKELASIPFREDFIQIFGDQEHFRPLGLGMRKALLELANQYNWSSVTTLDKIRYGLSTMRDHYMKDQILSFLR